MRVERTTGQGNDVRSPGNVNGSERERSYKKRTRDPPNKEVQEQLNDGRVTSKEVKKISFHL